MNVSPVKKRILEILWEVGNPLNRENISERIGLPTNSTMGHLLGLIKAEYVSVAEKNHYAITDLGKEALGFPKLDRKQALSILSHLPLEKAFHFYTAPNQYAGIHADSLDDFCRKILTVDLDAIEFHLPRRDFESWVNYLGDTELAKKMSVIRGRDLFGEALRKELYDTVKSRRDELADLSRSLH
jgi:hypothetical protein